MKVLLANPRGFCAGVDRAILIVNRALDLFGAPIYVRHEVVHNRTVVQELRDRGAIFVEELTEVPDGARVIFSAHGVSRAVVNQADARDLLVYDATCPLVTKVHNEVKRYSAEQRETILIGHAGHPEVEGTMGQFEDVQKIHLVEAVDDVSQLELKAPEHVAFVTQTTLSVDDTREVIDALKSRFPKIASPRTDDICYATQNRQDAVKDLAARCDTIFVVGSKNSSNSNRLCELARRLGVDAYLIDDENDINSAWLEDSKVVGITSGASAPEHLVQQVIEFLQRMQHCTVENLVTREETIEFSLPRELR